MVDMWSLSCISVTFVRTDCPARASADSWLLIASEERETGPLRLFSPVDLFLLLCPRYPFLPQRLAHRSLLRQPGSNPVFAHKAPGALRGDDICECAPPPHLYLKKTRVMIHIL